MSLYVENISDLRYHAKQMALPRGFNWRKCHTCMHYAVELFSEKYGGIKGRFCPHRQEMINELKIGKPCGNYYKREHPLYLRECAPQVLDADKCFYGD